jgi:hypothetical protein
MKKVMFSALAGLFVLTSIMGTTAKPVKINANHQTIYVINDSTPNRHKHDTSGYPRDTTSMPKLK